MKSNYSPEKFFTVLALLVFLGSVMPPASHGASIVVLPGRLDHFIVQMPEAIRAGEEAAVGLNVYDINNNLITNYPETGRDLRVSVSGSARIEPSMLMASAFKVGGIGMVFSDKKAENVTLSIFEVGGTVPIYTKEIKINPGKLDHFAVQSPQSATAGKAFEAEVYAKDAYENTISDIAMSKDITIKTRGTTDLKVVSVQDFRGGTASVSLSAEKTGKAFVDIQDIVTGGKGATQEIVVMPSALSHFSLSAPGEAKAGERFDVTVTALDAYENTITNYSTYGGGVNIISSGSAKVQPSYIGPVEFKEGKASAGLVYEKAEEIVLTAVEDKRTEQGQSAAVKVGPAQPERFAVITPDSAVSGQPFRIKIEAYDRFDNLVRDYSRRGADVYLSSSGKGKITPGAVSASDFVEGIAAVDVSYDIAESFTITAYPAVERQTGERRIRAVEPKAETPAVKPERKKEAIERPEKKPPAEKTEKKPLERPEIKPPEIKPVEKPEKLAAKMPPKAPEKPEKKPFELKSIDVIEAKEKALLVLKVPGFDEDLKFKDMLQSEGGREWLKIALKPAVFRVEKPLRFPSNIIGEVKKSESDGSVEVSFELLPKKIKYDVVKSKDTIVIRVTVVR